MPFLERCQKQSNCPISRFSVVGNKDDAGVKAQTLQHHVQERAGDGRIGAGHRRCGPPQKTYSIGWSAEEGLVGSRHHHVANGWIADRGYRATEDFSPLGVAEFGIHVASRLRPRLAMGPKCVTKTT